MIPAQLVKQDRAAMQRTASLAERIISEKLPDLSTLDQQAAGGVVRALATGTTYAVGNVATQASVASYGRFQAAVGATGFQPKALDVPKATAPLLDAAVGRSMVAYSQGMFEEAGTFLAVTVGRLVTNVYRQTMADNSDLDKSVVGYQRVASANACSFCALVALNQYTSFEESGGYHDHCSCSTVPIFRSTSPYRPDYYDTFESDYAAAVGESGSSKASDILAAMRVVSGRA